MWLNANDLRWFGRYRFCTHADRLLDLDLLGSLLQGPFPIAKVLQLESQRLGTHLGAPQHTSPGVSSSVQSNQLRRIARRCAMQDKGFALKNHQGGSHSNHISIFPCLTPSAKGFKICGAKTRGPKGFKICAESDSAGNRLVCRIEHGNGGTCSPRAWAAFPSAQWFSRTFGGPLKDSTDPAAPKASLTMSCGTGAGSHYAFMWGRWTLIMHLLLAPSQQSCSHLVMIVTVNQGAWMVLKNTERSTRATTQSSWRY